MRSLAAQLVALALAVSITTVASSHASDNEPVHSEGGRTSVATRGGHSTCRAYCQARSLRHQLLRMHGRTVALARSAALPLPAAPRLGWHRSALRKQLKHQAHVLGRYRATARAPLGERFARFQSWICIHRHEGAWNDRGDPYWGGLQMDRGFMRAYGGDIIARHHGGLADTWTPAEQILVAERAYASRGFAPWPNTSRACGVR